MDLPKRTSYLTIYQKELVISPLFSFVLKFIYMIYKFTIDLLNK